MKGQYIKNLETGKLELHFSKSDYLALPESSKNAIKSACLFSGRNGCWVSRATNNDWRAKQVATDLGLEDGGETGQRLSFAEQQTVKVERAEERAQRMSEHADNAQTRAAQAFDRADLREEKSGIPLGQPILVGHHSEGRHRRALERADNAMRKGIEEQEKASYFQDRAASARMTADQDQLKDRRYLQNRIDENEAQLRDIDRRLGKAHEWTTTPNQAEEYKTRLASLRLEYSEKLEYFKAAMSAIGGVQYSRQNVKAGDLVKIRGVWEKVVKSNGKTVASSSGVFPWPLKHSWAEVQDHKPTPLTVAAPAA